MDQGDRIKQTRLALNARLLLLFAGIMLIFNGITQTGRMGLGYLNFAEVMELESVQAQAKHSKQAELLTESMPESSSAAGSADSAGTAFAGTGEAVSEVQTEPDPEEIAVMILESGITGGDMRLIGIVSLIAAVFEIWTGAVCILFSNRLKRYRVVLCAVSALLIVEIIYLIVLISKKAFLLSTALWAIALPLVLLWSALRFRKLSLLEPDREYAIEPGRKRDTPQSAGPAPEARSRSLRERAMAVVPSEDEKGPGSQEEDAADPMPHDIHDDGD